MNSLTYKLAGIFLALSLVPLVIGITGAAALQTSETALTDNDKSLRNLSALIASAGQSLAENARIQINANSVTEQIAAAQRETNISIRDMADAVLPQAFAIARMRYSLAEASSAERALLLSLNMRHLAGDELKNSRETQIRNIQNAMRDLDEAQESFLFLLKDGEDRAAWDEFERSLTAWRINHKEFMNEIANLDKLVDDLIRGGPLFTSASRQAYDTVFITGRKIREDCEAAINALNMAVVRTADSKVKYAVETQAQTRALVDDLKRESTSTVEKSKDLREQIAVADNAAKAASETAMIALNSTSRRYWYMVCFSAVGVITAAVLGLMLAWRISQPVRKMAAHMSRLAMGDLTGDVAAADRLRRDEIGQLARAMQDMIHSTRAEIRMANAMAEGDYTSPTPLRSESDQLGRALGIMLATTNETLARVGRVVERVGTGAAAVSDASRTLSQGAMTSATALEEISRAVAHVDRQAKDNATQATEANNLATGSRDAAQRGYTAVTELVAAMNEIRQSGKRIASVAKLIDDIAFQTNLLALNAAVEAARAGRHGKGFSVVADEVRNLSGRSARAARETGEMVNAMTSRMEAGTALAARTDHEFREIVEATEQVARIFAGITSSSNAQSAAMAQISAGLSQIDGVIQENNASAAQTASSAQTLSHQAEELRRMISRFRLLAEAGKGTGAPGNDSHDAPPSSSRPLLQASRTFGDSHLLTGRSQS